MNAKQLLFVLCALQGLSFGQLQQYQITGEGLPPKTAVISIDDAPYEKWQSGPGEPPSWTLAIAEYLFAKKKPAVWFLVSCHFSAEPPPSLPWPDSVVCMGARDQDEFLISQLAAMRFVIANHSHSHIPASLLSTLFANPSLPPDTTQPLRDYIFTYEIAQTQQLVKAYQHEWHFFRAPGLDWPDWAARTANADSRLANLDGPVGVDVGGAFQLDNGTWMGGDWDCPNQGLTPEACGDLYLRDLRIITKTQGAFILLHNYIIPGWYALRVLQRIVENLGDIEVVDIRTHPAFKKPMCCSIK